MSSSVLPARVLWRAVRAVRGRFSAWFEGSAWAPLAGKALAYVAGFGVLALVGSGAATGLFSRIPGASAAPPAATVSAAPSVSASATPSLRPEPADHAGSEADAGTTAVMDAGPVALSDAGAATGAGAGAGEALRPGASGGNAGGITPDGKVALNAASEEDLKRLPGIGPSKAKAILALRAKLGRFRRAEDLLRVKGIGRRKLARLRPLLVVDQP